MSPAGHKDPHAPSLPSMHRPFVLIRSFCFGSCSWEHTEETQKQSGGWQSRQPAITWLTPHRMHVVPTRQSCAEQGAQKPARGVGRNTLCPLYAPVRGLLPPAFLPVAAQCSHGTPSRLQESLRLLLRALRLCSGGLSSPRASLPPRTHDTSMGAISPLPQLLA